MQENNFEGQVHNMMEGFTIDPSEKVWGNIQADIAGRKKSRFGMLPAALFMACFLLTTFVLHDLEKIKPSATKSNSSGINETIQSATTAQVNFNKKETVTVSQKNKIKITRNKDLDIVGLQQTKQIVETEKSKIKDISKQVTAANQDKEIDGEKEKAEMLQDKDAEGVKGEEVVVVNYDKKDSSQQTTPIKDLIKIDNAVIKEEQQKQNKKSAATKEMNSKKWDFFAFVSGGKFYTGNSYLSQIANVSYYYMSADISNGSGIPSNGFFQPSIVKSGFSYNITLKASRKLSRKTNVAIGVGYQHGGTSIRTGQMLSGALRENFATGSVNEFHNKYHFIQLPVEIQSMIGKGKKLPLYWNAGLTFSRLISADALQFDRTQGRYFKDNNYFNKSSISISGGLSLAILKKQKTQWLIGPQFYYSLTPVATKGLYDKTHYSFLGIQLQKKL